jgi:hypothetical protein
MSLWLCAQRRSRPTRSGCLTWCCPLMGNNTILRLNSSNDNSDLLLISNMRKTSRDRSLFDFCLEVLYPCLEFCNFSFKFSLVLFFEKVEFEFVFFVKLQEAFDLNGWGPLLLFPGGHLVSEFPKVLGHFEHLHTHISDMLPLAELHVLSQPAINALKQFDDLVANCLECLQTQLALRRLHAACSNT